MSNNPWNEVFKSGRFFHEPHPDLPALVQQLRTAEVKTVLDLGCGTGRHTVYLAQQGFAVYGLDSSPEGLQQTQQWLDQAGLTAELARHDMTEPLPYAADFFDAVISVQVIHHGTLKTVTGIVNEITRVTKSDGIIFITVPRSRNQAKTFQQIEPNTYVPLDGIEKGLPHHYFTPESLTNILSAFAVHDIHLDDVDHYCLTARKSSSV